MRGCSFPSLANLLVMSFAVAGARLSIVLYAVCIWSIASVLLKGLIGAYVRIKSNVIIIDNG